MEQVSPLPCPFCGSTAIAVIQGETFRWRVAECGCGARGPEVRAQTTGNGTPAEWDQKACHAAIVEWNRRAHSAGVSDGKG